LQGESINAHTTGEPCVAASLELDTLEGRVYLRSARSAEFVVKQQDGTGVLVRGEVWVQEPKVPRSELVPDLVKELALDTALAEELPAVVEEHVLRDGDRVALSGELTFEAVNRCAAGYRDGGLAKVLRGRPVLVKVLARA
jgi:hypothetical protein